MRRKVRVGGECDHVGRQDRSSLIEIEARTLELRSQAKKKVLDRDRNRTESLARVIVAPGQSHTSYGEPAIPTLVNFLRSTPSDLLHDYFDRLNLTLEPKPVWTAKQPGLGKALQKAVEALEEDHRQRVMNDADRINAMADEVGQTALFAAANNAEMLEALPNGYARAAWMLLHAPALLDRAEQVRFTDDRRYGRMWDGFISEPGLCVAPADGRLETFKQAIKGHFKSRNVEVELCARSRASLDQPTVKLLQAAIYREGRSGERKAFIAGELDRLLEHPVIEAAITYEAKTGVIEVVANTRETRDNLVRLFTEHLLSTPFQGERLRVRKYTLDRLRKPFAFPTDPEDNIESVRVTLLRLMPLDTAGERVTLECMRNAKRNIWQMAHDDFAERSPLHDGFAVTQVRFTVKFRPTTGFSGGRTLPVTVTMPTGCDLKDQTFRRQLIGNKYLHTWGLVRDV